MVGIRYGEKEGPLILNLSLASFSSSVNRITYLSSSSNGWWTKKEPGVRNKQHNRSI